MYFIIFFQGFIIIVDDLAVGSDQKYVKYERCLMELRNMMYEGKAKKVFEVKKSTEF